MANFEQAYEITMGHEGGYVNDNDDAGGETYKGVARKKNKHWDGWKRVDELKEEGDAFPGNLDDDAVFQEEIRRFYKQRYWDTFWGDDVSDQSIANELFDTGVNMGVGRAVKFLQASLNLLNRNGALYGEIAVDGGFGRNTLNALESYLDKDHPKFLFKLLNLLQGQHYIKIMTKSPVQEKYARGWLQRVDFSKSPTIEFNPHNS